MQRANTERCLRCREERKSELKDEELVDVMMVKVMMFRTCDHRRVLLLQFLHEETRAAETWPFQTQSKTCGRGGDSVGRGTT